MKALFRNSTFARLFAGRLVTNMGDSLYYIAAMWLVYDLGGSALYTGLAGFLTMFPQSLQFLTGPLVDRWNLRRILVVTQVLQGALVLVIPLAWYGGWLSVTVVLVVMPVVALLNQFTFPAENAALPRVVEKERLVDANSAFSFAYQGTSLVFRALGGLLIALVGAVSIYVVDSVTFAAAVLIFASVRIPPAADHDATDVASATGAYVEKLREGVDYVRGSVLVLVLSASVLVNGTIGATMAVLPVFAGQRGGSAAYGFMLAAVGGGILVGALVTSPLKRYSLSALSGVGFTLSAVAWFAAVAVHSLPLTVGLFFLAWIPVGVTNVIFAAVMQSVVPERLVGRVTSLTASAASLAMPVGSLLGGWAGDVWGPGLVVSVAGVGFLVITVGWLGHPHLRGLPPADDVDAKAFGLPTAE